MRWAFAFSLMITLAAGTPGDARADDLNDLPVRDLSELIADVLPPDGMDGLAWDYLLEAPFLSWQTFSTETVGLVIQRVAYARVRVGGVPAQALRGVWKELMWSVTLGTFGNEQAGPKWIEIKPGGLGDSNVCFGAQFRGCQFPAEKLFASPRLRGSAVCSRHQGSTQVYQVSAAGGKPSLVAYYLSDGKDGSISWIEIHPLRDRAKLCKASS
jgi:hypothetical protein